MHALPVPLFAGCLCEVAALTVAETHTPSDGPLPPKLDAEWLSQRLAQMSRDEPKKKKSDKPVWGIKPAEKVPDEGGTAITLRIALLCRESL